MQLCLSDKNVFKYLQISTLTATLKLGHIEGVLRRVALHEY